jgi:flagellar biosynthesis protein FlhF
MKAFVREMGKSGDNELLTAAVEARLATIEDLVSDLHEWMRSEQVASLPGAYRRLYSHLIASDFERRYATQITRAIHQSFGSREPSEEELRTAAAREIDMEIERMHEALPAIASRPAGSPPYIMALVGASGAGKTTMMYKLAVRGVLNYGLRVKIISSDTYKIGSVEGVQTIADILSVPFGIAFEPEEVTKLIEDSDVDLIVLDTAGRSDRAAREELYEFITAAHPDEIHLVLPATMSQRALQETAALFLGEKINYVTFTKVDEAPSLGGMISSVRWMGLPLGYISTGTAIPDDLTPSSDAPIGDWAVEGIQMLDHSEEVQHV